MSKNIIDYTKMRLGTNVNGNKIEVCPICGKKGLAAHYENGDSNYTHYAKIVLGFPTVESKDHCYVKKGEKK